MNIFYLTGKRLKTIKQTAISDQLLFCNSSVGLLAKESNFFKLLIKESLLIMRNDALLNKTIKSAPQKLFQLT